MADISTAFVTYLKTKSAVTDIIGSGADARIEPGSLTQGVAVPAIAYRRISTTHYSTINGTVAGLASTRMEINAIADTQLAADQLGEAIRLCGILDIQRETVASVMIQGVFIDAGNRQYTEEPEPGDHQRRYVASQDYQIVFNEEV